MRFFRSRLFRLIILLGSLSLVVTLPRSLLNLWKRRDIILERQEVLRRAQAENQRLRQELAEVASQAYIEKAAREKLGLVKPGEMIVLVPKSQNVPAAEPAKIEANLPNWKKWWRLFF